MVVAMAVPGMVSVIMDVDVMVVAMALPEMVSVIVDVYVAVVAAAQSVVMSGIVSCMGVSCESWSSRWKEVTY